MFDRFLFCKLRLFNIFDNWSIHISLQILGAFLVEVYENFNLKFVLYKSIDSLWPKLYPMYASEVFSLQIVFFNVDFTGNKLFAKSF